MSTLPVEQGVVDIIMDAMVDLFTLKLQTEIDKNDASRLTEIKVGPLQDDPTGIVVLIHENDPEDPRQWPHYPLRYRELQPSGTLIGQTTARGESEQTQLRHSTHFQMVGGGSRMARCFTIALEVWGDEILTDTPLERRDAGHLAAVIENRIIKTLLDAGPKIGTGNLITDSFGESVMMGPYLGDCWTNQEEGEALIVRKYIRVYYVTTQSWTIAAW